MTTTSEVRRTGNSFLWFVSTDEDCDLTDVDSIVLPGERVIVDYINVFDGNSLDPLSVNYFLGVGFFDPVGGTALRLHSQRFLNTAGAAVERYLSGIYAINPPGIIAPTSHPQLYIFVDFALAPPPLAKVLDVTIAGRLTGAFPPHERYGGG